MLTGVIASTEIEINIVVGALDECERIDIHHQTFYRGLINQKTSVVICICGVGKANAAYSTGLFIERFSPDIIYLIGIGGAYPSSGLNIGDIVIGEKEIYGDEGLALKDGFHTMQEIGLPVLVIDGIDYFNEFQLLVPEKLNTFKSKGNFVTVSSCTGSLEKAFAIEKKFKAICENMEGAAVAHICKLYGITPVEIRGISNIIGDREAAKLCKNDILKAAENVQRFFIECID
jgi:futalosine hydrolase